MTGEDARARLGQLVRRRRNELSLSLEAAARAAGISRPTWTGLEKATAQTETYMFARVEQVLGWKSGTIERVLDGGDPELNEQVAARRTAPASEPLIRAIWSDPDMDLAEKERWVEIVTRADAERRAAETKIEAAMARLAQSRDQSAARPREGTNG